MFQQLPALERFSHIFDLNGTLSVCENLYEHIVIFSARCGLLPLQVRARAGQKAVCIFCTNDSKALTSEDLGAVDAIWPETQSETLGRFFFSRLQRKLKLLKDYWLCRNYLEQTIDTLPDLVWYKDLQGLHWKVNQAFCNTVKKTKEDVRGKDHCYIWGLTREEYEKGKYVCMETEDQVIAARKTCIFDEFVKGNSGMRRLKTYKTPLFDENGDEIIGTLGIARDVTKEYQYREQILKMANSDYLTGLANRRYLSSYFEKHQAGQNTVLLYLDLDSFKKINDNFGHLAGDKTLVCVADNLKKYFDGGFISRIGGDEFVVLYFGRRDLDRLLQSYVKVAGAVKDVLPNTTVSLSLGVSQGEPDQLSLDELFRRGDLAMYQAKALGKSRYYIYGPELEK